MSQIVNDITFKLFYKDNEDKIRLSYNGFQEDLFTDLFLLLSGVETSSFDTNGVASCSIEVMKRNTVSGLNCSPVSRFASVVLRLANFIILLSLLLLYDRVVLFCFCMCTRACPYALYGVLFS